MAIATKLETERNTDHVSFSAAKQKAEWYKGIPDTNVRDNRDGTYTVTMPFATSIVPKTDYAYGKELEFGPHREVKDIPAGYEPYATIATRIHPDGGEESKQVIPVSILKEAENNMMGARYGEVYDVYVSQPQPVQGHKTKELVG